MDLMILEVGPWATDFAAVSCPGVMSVPTLEGD